MLFAFALFVGILIHIVTFRILKTQKMKWFKKLLFKSPQQICNNNDFIKPIIPFLNSALNLPYFRALEKPRLTGGYA